MLELALGPDFALVLERGHTGTRTRGRVVRYNLAYVNHLIYAGDDGRVLGHDSAHGCHHRHYRGRVTTVGFESFEQIEARFQKEWNRLAKEVRRAQD